MNLSSKELKLRAFYDTDSQQLAALCNNKNVWNNLRDYIPFPYKESDAKEFIDLCNAMSPQLIFAIEYREELVGCIGLVKQNDIYRLSAEIGYWIGEPYWGQGIATKSVQLITNYGFEELGLIRIHTGVFDFNKASQRVLEKASYKCEGVFEKSIIKNNKICDEYRFAIINPNYYKSE